MDFDQVTVNGVNSNILQNRCKTDDRINNSCFGNVPNFKISFVLFKNSLIFFKNRLEWLKFREKEI